MVFSNADSSSFVRRCQVSGYSNLSASEARGPDSVDKANISALDHVSSDSLTFVSISGNPSLSNCEAQCICDYLAIPGGSVFIEDNAPGCNSQEEVETACEVGVDESSVISSLSSIEVYPNPSADLIHIEIRQNYPKFLITIFNFSGEELISQVTTEPATLIDISQLPQGIYFVKVTGDEELKMLKFVKE